MPLDDPALTTIDTRRRRENAQIRSHDLRQRGRNQNRCEQKSRPKNPRAFAQTSGLEPDVTKNNFALKDLRVKTWLSEFQAFSRNDVSDSFL
jgi:hypothetical protein